PGTPRHLLPAPATAGRLSPSCAPSFRTTSYLARYIHRPPRELGGSRAPNFPAPRCIHYRPPGRSPPDRAAAAGTALEVDDGNVRIGRARGVRRSRSPPRAPMNARRSGLHGKAATRRKQVSRTLARVFAGWRTGLPRPVLVLQAGTAVNY